MKVLVTGSNGMIGSNLIIGLINEGFDVIGVDKCCNDLKKNNYNQFSIDLMDFEGIKEIIKNNNPDRIIHLAALAHATDGKKYTWEDYKKLNVDCSRHVFDASGDIPILFISTVDVLGFTNGIVTSTTPMHPVSNYGKSKSLAEIEVRKKESFDIFRLSPVYTESIKRDIQKRYYIKFPYVAYQIGNGTEYEILSIDNAVKAMVGWCSEQPKNEVRIVKDKERMWTPDFIKSEKAQGRAKIVLKVPFCIAKIVFMILKRITGENKYTYLLNKAVNPIRSE